MLAVFLALKNFLADLRGHHVLVRSDNTSVVSYINHQGGLQSRPLCKMVCQILLWSHGKLLSLRAAYILGAHNIGADILSPVLASSSSRTGRDGADVAEASSVCFSPDHSAPGSPGESSPGLGSTTSHCPTMAGQSMVPRFNIPSRQASSGAPRQEGPPVPSRGHDISPPTRTVETVGFTSEGAQLIDSGLSTKVVETILHSSSSLHEETLCLEVESFHFMV